MNLQFFGGRGGKSGKKSNNASSTTLQPSIELDLIQPKKEYAQDVNEAFNEMLQDYKQETGETITENDLKLIEDKMREMTSSDEVHVGIRFQPQYLDAILNDGRFKSQFETGTSEGYLDTDVRSEFENLSMGYYSFTSPEDRPIYGMLFEGKTAADIKPSQFGGDFYGGAVAIFKPSVKAHATVTFEDSLDYDRFLQPSPLLKPSRYSISSQNYSGFTRFSSFAEFHDLSKGKGRMRIGDFSTIDYMETQIHGGQATIKNIERIIFPKGTSQSSIPVDLLKKHNIKWNVES